LKHEVFFQKCHNFKFFCPPWRCNFTFVRSSPYTINNNWKHLKQKWGGKINLCLLFGLLEFSHLNSVTKEKDAKANCCKIYYLGHLGGRCCQINSLQFYGGPFWCKGLKRMFAWLLDWKAIRVAHSQAGSHDPYLGNAPLLGYYLGLNERKKLT
jgi:hypothetical protein